MKVGLFIPCYIDQLYPKVAIAPLARSEKPGLAVDFSIKQTCYGQPLANSGYSHLTASINALFVNNFETFDYIVSPSGSSALHVKEHLHVKENEAGCTHAQQHLQIDSVFNSV